MICERCLDGHVVFSMKAVRWSSTMHPVKVFKDAQGKHHVHDPNIVTTTHICPVDHVWYEAEARSCWCGWSATRNEGVDR